MHVASTSSLTHYGVHTKRGKIATDSIGILPKFRGRMVHDCWMPYFRYENCEHSLCNVHHLRDLAFVHEQYENRWAKKMHSCLLEMLSAVSTEKERGKGFLPSQKKDRLLQEYSSIVKLALKTEAVPAPILVCNETGKKRRGKPKKGKSGMLAECFDIRKEQILASLNDFQIPFGNNQAEQAIPMVRVEWSRYSKKFQEPTEVKKEMKLSVR